MVVEELEVQNHLLAEMEDLVDLEEEVGKVQLVV
jgi:hypothetical protein|tara:strand:+ start:768 stop:869 length:102 start_codon:yes stop_codon:yes gene_type:complete